MTALPDYQAPDDIVRDNVIDRERFRVEDDAAAAWAMRKLARIRDKQNENKRIADSETTRISMWLDDVNGALDYDAQYFESLLMDYARRQRELEGRKSVILPHGKVASRATQPKWHVNEEALMPWAKENMPDAIIVKESLSLSALKERCTENNGKALSPDGEIIPGVVIDAADVSYTITTD